MMSSFFLVLSLAGALDVARASPKGRLLSHAHKAREHEHVRKEGEVEHHVANLMGAKEKHPSEASHEHAHSHAHTAAARRAIAHAHETPKKVKAEKHVAKHAAKHAAKAKPFLAKGKKAKFNGCALLLAQVDVHGAEDPFCKHGLASADLQTCCQADCGECSEDSDMCANKDTTGRGSTCCPSEISTTDESCAEGRAPCNMPPPVTAAVSANAEANAAWDCNRAIPDEIARQRVATDYLKSSGKELSPKPADLDCDTAETVVELAYDCEQRSGCAGFTMHSDGSPGCMYVAPTDLSEMIDSTEFDTYVRAVESNGLTFHYEVSEWHACSVTCGDGTQPRDLYCRSEEGADYDLSSCQGIYSVASTPEIIQDCNMFACPCEHGIEHEELEVGITIFPTADYLYDSYPTLNCEEFDVNYTGTIHTHCVEYAVGHLEHEDGTCYRKCLPSDGPVVDNDADVALTFDLVHEDTRTIDCPVHWTGQVTVLCTDGELSKHDGDCFHDCPVADVCSSMNGPGALPDCPTTDYHHEQVEVIACPTPSSTGQYEITCSDGTATATGACHRHCDSASVNALLGGPTDPAFHADWLAHEATQELSCPSGSTGSVEISCDDGNVARNGACYYDCTGAEQCNAMNQDHGIQLQIEGGGDSGPLMAQVGGGTMGYMCDDYFDANDNAADVACRQMGYASGVYSDPGDISGGSSNFVMDDVQCTGQEGYLAACTYITTNNCGDSEVVGVACSGGSPCGLNDIVHEESTSVECPTGYWGTVELTCNNGDLTTQGECELYPGTIDIRIDGDNGQGPLMASVNGGEYGYVCDDYFDSNDNAADVACKTLGFAYGKYMDPGDVSGAGDNFVIDDVQCSGGESVLTECSFARTDNCGDTEVAGVVCHGGAAVQLDSQGNTGPLMAQFGSEGIGYVCDDYFDANNNAANVVCRQLGFAAGEYVDPGDVAGAHFTVDDVQCNGDESQLDECQYTRVEDCGDGEVAGVRCFGNVQMEIHGGGTQGALMARLGDGSLGFVCDDYFDSNDNAADVACKQMGFSGGRYYDPGEMHDYGFTIDDVQCDGSEQSIDRCSYILTHNCGASEVAGVQCSSEIELDIVWWDNSVVFYGSSGVLRARVGDGEWGDVCDHYWGDANAHVACRTMGWSTGVTDGYAQETSPYGWSSDGNWALNNVQCTDPTTSDISQCGYSTTEFDGCGPNSALAVQCTGLQFRLSEEAGGIVQARTSSGYWGYVCDDHFDSNDNAANVICRQLGFSSGTYYDPGDVDITQTDPITNRIVAFSIDDLICQGHETGADQCSYVTAHNCGGSEVAGVQCL